MAKVIEEILPIPHLEPKIIDAAANGKLVIFAGAGLSIGLKCPSWDQLAQKSVKILEDLEDSDKRITHRVADDLRQISNPRRLLSITWLMMRSRCPDLGETLKELFPTPPERSVYDELVEFRCPIITTNYDLNLDQAIKRYDKLISISGDEQDSTTTSLHGLNQIDKPMTYLEPNSLSVSNLRPYKALYLHGSIKSPEHMLVTTSDYLSKYRHDDPLPSHRQFMMDLFEAKKILFLGSSMGEFEILEYLASRDRSGHFIVEPFWEASLVHANLTSDYFDAMGIELVPYAKDTKGYSQLNEIVSDWKGKVRSVATPPPTIDGLRIIDSVQL